MDEDKATSLKGPAVRGAAWSLADKWGVRIASLATFAVLARMLEPAEFGVVAAAQVVVLFLQTVSNQGIVQALVVSRSVTARLRATATTVALLASVTTVAAIWALSHPLAGLFEQPDLSLIVTVLALTLTLQAAGAVPTAALQRQLQFKRLAQRSVISAVLSGVVGIGGAVAGWGAWALVAQSLTQAFVATALAWVAANIRFTIGWNRSEARSLLRFAGPVMLADIVSVGIVQGDNLVVGVVLGPVLLGYYTIAFRLLNVVTDAFTGVMSAVALPVFARLSMDSDASRRAYLRATQISFAVATPVFLALATAAPTIIELFFGSQWDRSVPVFQVLCLAGITMSALYFDKPLILAAGRVRLELLVSLTLAVATVVAALIGSQFGLLATAICVTARMYVTWPLRFFAVRRVISISGRDYVRRLRGVVGSGVVQAGVSLALLALLPANDSSRMGAAVVGAASYLLMMWCVDRDLVRNALSMLHHIRSSPGSRDVISD